MKLRHQSLPARSGFTLIELVIVLVLITIMTAMIIPEMRGTYEGELLRSTSRELVRGLSLAHSQSITLNQRHRLVIDREKNRCRVERFARGEEEGNGYVPVRGLPGAEAALSDKITIEMKAPGEAADGEGSAVNGPGDPPSVTTAFPGMAVEFLPDGTAQAMEIHLRDRGGFGYALRVSPITARVKVVELERRGGD